MIHKNQRHFKFLLIAAGILSLSLGFIYSEGTKAAFNPQLNYQGKLTNSLNVAVADGAYNMEFKLYTAASGGTAIWTETRTGANAVTVTNGLFSVMLGEVNALAGVDFNQTLYLSVNIGGIGTPAWDGEMSPRKKLGAVPAAFVADKVGDLDSSQVASKSLAGATIYVDAGFGNDTTGNGTSGSPYASITRALEDVPDVLKHSYTIQLAAGTYRETVHVNKSGSALSASTTANILTIRGDPAAPNSYRITSATAGADTTATRNFGAYISAPFMVMFEGLRMDYHTTAAVYAIDSIIKTKDVNISNSPFGLYLFNNTLLDLRSSGTLNISGNGPSVAAAGIYFDRGGQLTSSSSTVVNISESKFGFYSQFASLNANTNGATFNITNSTKVAGSYGVWLAQQDAIHSLKLNVTRFDVGVTLGNSSYLDLDAPSSFTDVNTAISASFNSAMDVDATTFSSVTNKYSLNGGAVIDATEETSTSKMLISPSGATNIADSSTAIAYDFDTLNNLSTAGSKLLSLKNAGSEMAFVDKDGNLSLQGTLSSSVYTSAGSVAIKPGVDSTTAVQIQNAVGSSIVNVDTSNGRVGIGTVAPDYPLHVTGAGYFTGNVGIGAAPSATNPLTVSVNSGGFRYLTVQNTNAGTSAGAGITVQNDTSVGGSFQVFSSTNTSAFDGLTMASYARLQTDAAVNGLLIGTTGVGDPLYLYTAGVRRLAIDGTGNVGIGTTTPADRLHVVGGTVFGPTTGGTYNGNLRALYNDQFPNFRFYSGATQTGQVMTNMATNQMIFDTTGGAYLFRNGIGGSNIFTVGPTTSTLSSALSVDGAVTVNNRINVFSNDTVIQRMRGGTAAVDQRTWEWRVQADGQLDLRSTTDAGATLLTPLAFSRTTGVASFIYGVTAPSVIGGTASAGSLTLQSTTNATKGKILFGTSAYDEVNNRLGIGTASPSSLLSVYGNDAAAPVGVRIENANSTQPAQIHLRSGLMDGYMKVSSTGLRLYAADSQPITFGTGTTDTERMRIDHLGNVGIGVTDPQTILQIVRSGTRTLPNSNNVASFQNSATSTTDANMSIISGNAATAQLLFGDTDSDVVGRINYSHSLNNMRFWTNGSEKMVIESSGSVAIGASTASAGKLFIQATGTDSSSGLALFNPTSSASARWWIDSSSVQRLDNGSTASGSIALNSGGIGKVGIGVIPTNAQLEIAQTVSGSNFDALAVVNSGTTASTSVKIIMGATNGLVANTNGRIDQLGTRQSDGSMDFNLLMSPGGGIAPTSRFFIDGSTGNVGIGTISPSARIHSLANTEQLRLGYDATNYSSLTTGSTGDLTIAPTGGDASVTGNLGYTGTLSSSDLLGTVMDILPSYHGLKVTRNGSGQVRIGSGISSPTYALHIVRAAAVDSYPRIVVGDSTNSKYVYFGVDTVNQVTTYDSTFGTGGAWDTVFRMGGSEKLRLTTGGRLGIGTSSPSELLAVGTASEFNVSAAGAITGTSLALGSGAISTTGTIASGSINGQTISSAAIFTGTVGIGVSSVEAPYALDVKNSHNVARFLSSSPINTIRAGLTLETRNEFDTPGAGLGAAVNFKLQDSGLSAFDAGMLSVISTDVTDTSEDADMVFSLMRNGSANQEAMRLTSAGNLGIGMTPSTRLDVYQNTAISNTDLFRILSDVGSTSNVKLRVDSDGDLFLDGTITAGSTTITAGSADLAEEYNVLDDSQAGHIVASVEDVNVQKSSSAYQNNILGVVATKPGLVLSLKDENGHSEYNNPKPIALAGRVPVKVTSENGPIKVGDPIVSGSIPGVGMKGLEPGMAVGYALESYNGPEDFVGEVLIYVKTGFALGGEDESTATSTQVSQTDGSVLDSFTKAVRKSLGKLGLTIKDGVAQFKEIVTDKISARKARLEKIEMVDQATGDIYCTWIQSGDWVKVKSDCDSAQAPAPVPASTEPTTTDTDTTTATDQSSPSEATSTTTESSGATADNVDGSGS